VAISECPTSYISSESIALLEGFVAWNMARQSLLDAPARLADAILTLDQETRKARIDG
jgi:hypothetical protein